MAIKIQQEILRQEVVKPTPHYRISVVTPTFNRADKIHRVFESLKAQTYHDFEWIVIDDGSTDNTKAIIEGFRALKPFFPIIYHYQFNTGVVGALGASLPFIHGDFVIKCDSDDSYVPTMIEDFIRAWEAIPEDKRGQFRGVSAPVMDQEARFFGRPLGREFLDALPLDVEHKWKRREERLWFERADLWYQFHFEAGIADHLIWYPQIIREYKVRFIDTPLRIYYRGEAGALTNQKTPAMAYSRFTAGVGTLSFEMDYFFFDPFAFIWRASNVWLYGSLLGLNPLEITERISSVSGKVLLWLSYPLGILRRWGEKRGDGWGSTFSKPRIKT
jgi:glycosyltransferase involved in cell wall biosynthesis